MPTGLEVGATQESVPDETVVVGDASGIGMWEEEQTMSPVLIGDVETVLAGFGLERRPLKQSLPISPETFSATRNFQRPGNYTIPFTSRRDTPPLLRECPSPVQRTPL